ncbi:MAG: Kelch repeat-containing protein [Verrucomicrobiaceae bacterium]|nr:Kelch repeat-containing protein [Verrucomicrobiaceae bacterium]
MALTSSTLLAASIAPADWQHLPDIPDQLGLAGAFAGVVDGALVMAGGANFPDKMPWDGGIKRWHDTVWVLDKPEGAWRNAGKLPRPLGYGVSATAPKGLICVGGSDLKQHHNEAFRLSLKDGAVVTETLPSLPLALANCFGALVGNDLYVVGGNERAGELECVNRAFVLNVEEPSAAWKEIEPIPGKPRFLCAAAAHEGALFICGGTTLEPQADGKLNRVYLKETWSYRPGKAWTQLADMLQPAVAAPSPMPMRDGKLLVLGGDDGSHWGFQPPAEHPGFPALIQGYDVKANQWREAGSLPAGRAVLPSVVWRDRIVLINGEQRPGVRSPRVWSLSVDRR